jgi:hypothetical protein
MLASIVTVQEIELNWIPVHFQLQSQIVKDVMVDKSVTIIQIKSPIQNTGNYVERVS